MNTKTHLLPHTLRIKSVRVQFWQIAKTLHLQRLPFV